MEFPLASAMGEAARAVLRGRCITLAGMQACTVFLVARSLFSRPVSRHASWRASLSPPSAKPLVPMQPAAVAKSSRLSDPGDLAKVLAGRARETQRGTEIPASSK
jgi:hypothetical protein